jgi:deoxyribonuclease-1
VYFDREVTGYCNCEFTSDGDSDGSGDITGTDTCGYRVADKWERNAAWVEWEHVVPASLMPARRFECWSGEDGSRERCIEEDSEGREMLLDLHNLVPSIGQINQYRGNLRYGGVGQDRGRVFGSCEVQVTERAFEPPDCRKGDVARIWFYMADQHGVEIGSDEREMLNRWSDSDAISPWELKRAARIEGITGKSNPYVQTGSSPDPSGACK